MKVLVTDGNNRATLAITRSLGKEGYNVIVCSEVIPCLASVSKYCHKSFSYPSPQKQPELFSARIQEIVISERPEVVLPVSEITTILMMSLKNKIVKFTSIPFGGLSSVDRAASKYDMVRLAQKLNIPIPRTYFLEEPGNQNDVQKFFDAESFPVVIKSSRSRIANMDGWHSTAVKYANSCRELIGVIDSTPIHSYPLLLQERIYGPGIGIFMCFNHGKMIASFSHRRLREKPPSGGVSVLRESIPVDEKLKSQSEQLLKALNWHGVAMVEFKQDTMKKDFKLMEINGRFWGSLQLAIDAGVNFPLLAVQIALGAKIIPKNDYKVGIKTRWFWGDVDALLSRLFKPAKHLKLPDGFPGRLKYLLSFLKFWGKDLNYEILRKDDIKPWLLETRRWFLGK